MWYLLQPDFEHRCGGTLGVLIAKFTVRPSGRARACSLAGVQLPWPVGRPLTHTVSLHPHGVAKAFRAPAVSADTIVATGSLRSWMIISCRRQEHNARRGLQQMRCIAGPMGWRDGTRATTSFHTGAPFPRSRRCAVRGCQPPLRTSRASPRRLADERLLGLAGPLLGGSSPCRPLAPLAGPAAHPGALGRRLLRGHHLPLVLGGGGLGGAVRLLCSFACLALGVAGGADLGQQGAGMLGCSRGQGRRTGRAGQGRRAGQVGRARRPPGCCPPGTSGRRGCRWRWWHGRIAPGKSGPRGSLRWHRAGGR